MANAVTGLVFTSAVVTVSGTSVAPTVAIPDNCAKIVLQNRGAGDAIFGRAAPGAGTLTEGTNAYRLVANAVLILEIGTQMSRGFMVEALVAGSGLVYDGIGGSTPTVQVVYECVLGVEG